MKHEMVMRYPATRWQDALPSGSGIVGAMVYGSIQQETILVNHDALYYPGPEPESVNVSNQLARLRELVLAGKCREAAQVLPTAYDERKTSTEDPWDAPYQPLCVINLQSAISGAFRKYRRGVDFSSGRAWVEWVDEKSSFTRELFVSRRTDTITLRIRATDPGAVTCRISLEPAKDEQVGLGYFGRTNDLHLESSQAAVLEDQTISFVGSYPDGLSFGGIGRIDLCGGSIRCEGNALVVEDADELLLRLQLFIGEPPEAAVARLTAELIQDNAGFDTAFEEHCTLHGELYSRMTLELGAREQWSNEEMLLAAYDGEMSTALAQTMFELGRYLLICSSRSGGWPANLQGIWNGDYVPAWCSDIHTDENIQMNYWQALPGNLAETTLPLFDYFEKHLDAFRANARDIFDCRGILIPIAMTVHGRERPRSYSNWTAAAGWIAQHFYDYFLFTGDLEFLRHRAVPWLTETALFYEDFLIEGDDGKLLFCPSISPENRPRNGNSLITMNATMDVAICREVLTNLCDACSRLSIEHESVKRWQAMLAKLPDYEINGDGAIKEWLHPAFEDNYHHRHQSHLYPVFPGLEITRETAPALYEACRVAVEKRLVIGLNSQTGWSMAHMANIYARLGLGNRARECLEILTRSSLGPNLFTYHNDWRKMGLSLGGTPPPFQIDANLGFTAAILEMLAYSKPKLLKLLPALPDAWTVGRVTGIACRGGITLDMEWDRSQGTFRATLLSRTDQQITLCLPTRFGKLRFDSETAVASRTVPGESYWDLSLSGAVPFCMLSAD